MTEAKKKSGSGEHHPTTVAFRKKLDSVNEVTIPVMQQTLERAGGALSSTPPALASTPQADPISGSYTLTIQGVGKHHNLLAADADRLLARFVQTLRANGHEITHALFRNGDEQSVADADTYLAEPKEAP